MARIIIDAGHGGSGRAGSSSAYGSRGPSGLLEKDVTLDIARHVVARLGGDAALTRTGDSNLSLGARAAHASRDGADVFVSIHANSGPPEMSGPETWVHPEAGGGSHQLAGGIQRALERLAGRYGGSAESRRGPMAVLSPSALGRRTAACLVEVDYLSSPQGERRLGNPDERAAIAGAIAGAIREHVDRYGHSGDSGRAPRSGSAPGRVGRAYAEAAAIVVPEIDYSATSLGEAAEIWIDWLARFAQWSKGVPDEQLTYFPHAAICAFRLYSSTGGPAYGTGFYIGSEKILTCGHNFYDRDDDGSIWETTRVEVMPGWNPTRQPFPTRSFNVTGRDLVHPDWRASWDNTKDLAVLRVPGLPAQRGTFQLANRSLGSDEGIVVCGYGKVDGQDYERQGQRMDGAHIAEADTEMVYYPIQTEGGHSGSPVFSGSTVIGVHTGPRLRPRRARRYQNRGVLLNPDKIDWINGR